MSQIRKAFFGAAAVTLALGAVQLASGQDLLSHWRSISERPNHIPSHVATTHVASYVNRSDKSDRLADPKIAVVPSRTVALRLNDLANTSVVLRVPPAQARTTKPPPVLLQNHIVAPTLACEPMVSALTEIVRLLQPGRCVT